MLLLIYFVLSRVNEHQVKVLISDINHVHILHSQTMVRDEESGPIFLPICTLIDCDEPLYHKSTEECLNAFLNIEECMSNV